MSPLVIWRIGMSEEEDECVEDPSHMLQPSGIQAWQQPIMLATPRSKKAQGVVKQVPRVFASGRRALATFRGLGFRTHYGVESTAKS